MNPAEIAARLVALCRTGAFETAQRELFAADAVSLEPAHTKQPPTTGLDAIVAKGKTFVETMEIHGLTVGDPVVAGPIFSLAMTVDVTPRGAPAAARFTMAEICVFETRGGKIVSEQFFYPAQGC
ncbi:MAG: hypothetical protein RLZZ15_2825 [Verrucomicrobiota bacterium]|jgi:hypothetical protein